MPRRAAARRIGFPVALKILSPDITHKSDVGGVALDLRDAGSACARPPPSDAGRASASAARRRASTASRCSRWCAGRIAQELIVGASVDPVFGPVMLFGQGGTAVEVIADRAIALPPLNRVAGRAT